MHPSVFLSEHLAPNHHRHRQGERPTHQLAESLCRDEFVNKKCHEKAENSLREAVKSAIAAGYTYIDTAAIYKNEKSVGEGIKENSLAKMLIS